MHHIEVSRLDPFLQPLLALACEAMGRALCAA